MTHVPDAMQLQSKSFGTPDESRAFGAAGRLDIIHLGPTTVVRATFQPGFRWTEHVKPIVGTDLCQVRHVGCVVSGKALIRLADGTVQELAAGTTYDVPPGHDAWTVGDEPYVSVDFSST
jgi:hypothetical protein